MKRRQIWARSRRCPARSPPSRWPRARPVEAGQTLVVLEAMKMEHRIVADTDGVVDEVLVSPGQSVDAHQVLVTFATGGHR